MAKMLVKNNWKKPVRIGRVVLRPGTVEPVDEALLYTDRVQRLRKAEKLIFPFRPETVESTPDPQPKAVADEPVEPEDLTALIHIGTGRLKTLNSFGIFTFAQVVDHAENLHEILEIPEDQAAEVVEDAKNRS